MRDRRGKRHVHHRLHRARFSLATRLFHRAVDDLAIEVITDRRHVAVLLRPEQVARAADLKVPHGNLEACAELRELADGAEPLLRHLGEHLIPHEGQVCIAEPGPAPHAATQLIKLGKAHFVRLIHEDGVHIRDVQPAFNDRAAQEHIIALLHEVKHRLLQLPFLHLPVCVADARFRHERAQLLRKALHVAHAVIDEIHLPAAANLLEDRLPRHAVAVFHYIGLHGIALLRRRFDDGHIADAGHGHVQRARDGRCRKRQHVHALPDVLDLFLMAHAEALFLVDDKKAEVLEADVLTEEFVRADHHVDAALFKPLENGVFILARFEA